MAAMAYAPPDRAQRRHPRMVFEIVRAGSVEDRFVDRMTASLRDVACAADDIERHPSSELSALFEIAERPVPHP